MSALSSTTNVVATPEYVNPNILEKIESQRAPGELTPIPIASPPLSLRDEKLEEGDTKPEDRQPVVRRPTGIKVHYP
jgi:hypothetical protein